MSRRIFLLLLKLYPSRFRAEYGESMLQIFQDRLASETGFFARMRLWMDLILDTLICVPKEYLRPVRPPTQVTAGGYRLSEAGVAEMVRRSHITQLRGFFVVIAFGFALGWFGDASRLALSICYGVLAALATYALRQTGAFKDYWRNFELTLLEDGLRQRGPGRPEMELRREEITGLLETPGVGLAVCTAQPARGAMVFRKKEITWRLHDIPANDVAGFAEQPARAVWWIPSVLNGYQEVRARLANWAPIQVSGPSKSHSMHGFDTIWLIGLCPAALLIQSPYFALPLAALLITAVGLQLATVMRHPVPPIPSRVRRKFFAATRGIPIVLLLVLIAKVVLMVRSL